MKSHLMTHMEAIKKECPVCKKLYHFQGKILSFIEYSDGYSRYLRISGSGHVWKKTTNKKQKEKKHGRFPRICITVLKNVCGVV